MPRKKNRVSHSLQSNVTNFLSRPTLTLLAHTRNHNSHSDSHPHGTAQTTATTTGPAAPQPGNTTTNALLASIPPVSTLTPGAATAHALATTPIEAPSTIPKPAGTGAAAASLEGKNKVIVVFKKETPIEEIDEAVKDVVAQGS